MLVGSRPSWISTFSTRRFCVANSRARLRIAAGSKFALLISSPPPLRRCPKWAEPGSEPGRRPRESVASPLRRSITQYVKVPSDLPSYYGRHDALRTSTASTTGRSLIEHLFDRALWPGIGVAALGSACRSPRAFRRKSPETISGAIEGRTHSYRTSTISQRAPVRECRQRLRSTSGNSALPAAKAPGPAGGAFDARPFRVSRFQVTDRGAAHGRRVRSFALNAAMRSR